MRISDWSSDVCSSDLDRQRGDRPARRRRAFHPEHHPAYPGGDDARRSGAGATGESGDRCARALSGADAAGAGIIGGGRGREDLALTILVTPNLLRGDEVSKIRRGLSTVSPRSEEHTTELQSLLRTSYAVS